MEQKNKIILIGGFGFIGYHLARALLVASHSVIVFGHRSGRTRAAFDDLKRVWKDKLEFVEGEVASDDLHLLLHRDNDISGVFHLAAMKSTTQTRDREDGALLAYNYDMDIEVLDFSENVLSHRNYNADPRRVKMVYISTGEVHGDNFKTDFPMSENDLCLIDPNAVRHLYPASKLAGEMMLKHGGWNFEWNIVRLQNPYGPFMGENMLIPKLVRAAIEARVRGPAMMEVYGGYDTRPYVYVEDVAQGLIDVYLRGKNKETYNIAGDDVPIRKLAQMVGREFTEQKLNFAFVNNTAEHRQMDITKIKTALGWWPKIDIKMGITKMFDFYQKHDIVERAMKDMGL